MKTQEAASEVSLFRDIPIASELPGLDSINSSLADVAENPSKSIQSIPKLNIAMLVVGTRGDVQPFMAIARKLQVC